MASVPLANVNCFLSETLGIRTTAPCSKKVEHLIQLPRSFRAPEAMTPDVQERRNASHSGIRDAYPPTRTPSV